MYAHQVIDDLKKAYLTTESGETYRYYLDFCCEKISKESIKFSLVDFFKKNEGTIYKINKNRRVFSYDRKIYKLPYKTCYFDWEKHGSEDVDKQASLVIDNEDENIIEIYCLQHYKKFGVWIMHPSIYGIEKENPDVVGAMQYIHMQGYSYNEIEPDQCILTRTEKIILLLNCKNISKEENNPPEALNKKRIKNGKQPLFTYHTLVVDPIGAKNRVDTRHEQTGIKQRLHLCRGHFKEYTETNKLFGKHTGLYWWQPMVRGNKELGIVHKDYHVKAA